MSTDYTVEDIQGIPSASAINENLNDIAAELDEKLDRRDRADNQMKDDLDMDSNRIVNLPEAIGNTEPVPLHQIGEITSTAVFLFGDEADRPDALVENRYYIATDTEKVFRDNGDSWDTLLEEWGATDDQTGAEIKAAYEAEDDTNAFTDADHSKLDDIEDSATADQTDEEIQDAAWDVLTGAQTLIDVTYDDANNEVDFEVEPNLSAYTNDAGFITATLTDEEVQDVVGAMLSANTETFITATYQDADGTIDLVVPVLDEDDLVSNSDAHLATQQSIKAYVDGVGSPGAIGNLSDVDITSVANGELLVYNSTSGNWENDTVAGSGDVVGPASSTDNAIVRFDGTGGGSIQNSGWTLDDSDVMAAADNVLERPEIKDYAETVNTIGSIGGGTQDISLESGNVVTGTVDTSETTFTFSDPPATGIAGSFTLILTNGGSQTVNWPASVNWAGGASPALTAAGVDVLTFLTVDGGTNWYGFPAGLDMQ